MVVGERRRRAAVQDSTICLKRIGISTSYALNSLFTRELFTRLEFVLNCICQILCFPDRCLRRLLDGRGPFPFLPRHLVKKGMIELAEEEGKIGARPVGQKMMPLATTTSHFPFPEKEKLSSSAPFLFLLLPLIWSVSPHFAAQESPRELEVGSAHLIRKRS